MYGMDAVINGDGRGRGSLWSISACTSYLYNGPKINKMYVGVNAIKNNTVQYSNNGKD